MVTTPAIKLLVRSLNAKPIAILMAPAITRKFCNVILKMIGIIIDTAAASKHKRVKGMAARKYSLNLLGPCFARIESSLWERKVNNHTETTMTRIWVS